MPLERVATYTAGRLWHRYVELETIVDVGNTLEARWSPARGTTFSAVMLTLTLALLGETLALQTTSQLLPLSLRFTLFLTALVAAGMYFTSRYATARGDAWAGGKHGKVRGFLRSGVGGVLAASAALLSHARGVPALVLSVRGGGAALFVVGFAAGCAFPFLARAVPALGGSLRIGGGGGGRQRF